MARILIIEDDPQVREILKVFLEGKGYLLVEANSAELALKILESKESKESNSDQPISLIILDIVLPGMDGFQFAKIKLENQALCQIPLIILSARGQVIDVTMGLHLAKAKAYLTKPFHLEKIATTIEDILKDNFGKNGI